MGGWFKQIHLYLVARWLFWQRANDVITVHILSTLLYILILPFVWCSIAVLSSIHCLTCGGCKGGWKGWRGGVQGGCGGHAGPGVNNTAKRVWGSLREMVLGKGDAILWTERFWEYIAVNVGCAKRTMLVLSLFMPATPGKDGLGDGKREGEGLE